MKVENKTIIITDPCYIINKKQDSDWEKCDFGDNMEALGIDNYICRSTGYGDWSCTTYDSDSGKEIGKFCADAGLVGVFELDEVLKYNPSFDWWESKPWTTTKIDNFTGNIHITYDDSTGSNMVVGKGNINFETHQTGL